MSGKVLKFERSPEARQLLPNQTSQLSAEATKADRVTANDLEFHEPDFARLDRARAKGKRAFRLAVVRLARDWHDAGYESGRLDAATGTHGRS